MAEVRESFAILEDVTTKEGVGLSRKNEGDVAAGGEYAGLLPVKDNSGNLQFITTDANGKIPVSLDAPGTPGRTRGTVTATVGAAVDVVNHTLTASASFDCIEFTGSCTKTCLWELVQDNNGSETVLERVNTGPGDYKFMMLLDQGKFTVTAGATGTQELVLRGTQLTGTGSATDLHGRVSTNQKP